MKPMPRSQGFTLIEMAVVVAVIALLLGSILVPLATQVEERRFGETRRMLDDAREALLGFAIANGRLPCPASGTSSGLESPTGGGPCTNPYNGFLPAATLGIQPTDDQGLAIDPWGNRIRYAAAVGAGADLNVFTTANGISNRFLTGTPTPDIHVCSTGILPGSEPPFGFPICNAGPPDTTLTKSAAAVLFSVGPNGRTGGTSTDEAQNPNPNSGSNDRLFVSRPQRSADTTAGEFDDIVIWLSPHILYNRMVAAGKLP
jgi:prepilin-type N-terminal cleavage/methylation domain-containing protein